MDYEKLSVMLDCKRRDIIDGYVECLSGKGEEDKLEATKYTHSRVQNKLLNCFDFIVSSEK